MTDHTLIGEASAGPARPPHMPENTPDFLAQAWVDCLRWASASTEVLDAYEQSGGLMPRPVRNGLDAMIDRATGINEAAFEAFVAWFNENIWGNGPIDEVDDG